MFASIVRLKILAAWSLVALIAAGCDESKTTAIDSAIDESTIKIERARLLLTAEPPEAKSPTEIKETVTEPSEMVVAGRIDAGDMEPFEPGKASFMISQLPDEGHGADDPNHADNCPFCKRKLKNAPKAIVKFVDGDGKLLELDAQELFDIDKGDVVLVRGLVEYQEVTNTISVQADGLYRK